MEKKYKTVLEFKDDITLMFNNCRLYNGPESGEKTCFSEQTFTFYVITHETCF